MLQVVSFFLKRPKQGHKDENSHRAKTGKRKKNTTKTNLKTCRKPRWWIKGQRDVDWAGRLSTQRREGGGGLVVLVKVVNAGLSHALAPFYLSPVLATRSDHPFFSLYKSPWGTFSTITKRLFVNLSPCGHGGSINPSLTPPFTCTHYASGHETHPSK